jgi:hypothetical protein
LSGAAYGAGIQFQRNEQLRIRYLVDLDQACAGRLIRSAHDRAIAARHERDQYCGILAAAFQRKRTRRLCGREDFRRRPSLRKMI